MTTKISHFKVNSGVQDRMRVPHIFWAGLKKFGLAPGVVLRHGDLPLSAYNGDGVLTTGQLFVLWRSIRELSNDPAIGWKLMNVIDSAQFNPTLIAALHARSYRESLERHARYKQLCGAQEFKFTHQGAEFRVEVSWPFVASVSPPAILIDAVFSMVTELGRRGTRTNVTPVRVELARRRERESGLEDYFGCPVKYRCSRDVLVLNMKDVELPFVTHNEELVEMLAPQLEKQLESTRSTRSAVGSVKWMLRRLLSGSRPDVAMVAKELGMSERTLQRRITGEGTTFRKLLNETRKELVREYLDDESIEITEAAFLVGFENTNSFYRAFRSWEGKTPGEWRAANRRTKTGRGSRGS